MFDEPTNRSNFRSTVCKKVAAYSDTCGEFTAAWLLPQRTFALQRPKPADRRRASELK